jgi:hypothetical protein
MNAAIKEADTGDNTAKPPKTMADLDTPKIMADLDTAKMWDKWNRGYVKRDPNAES